MQAAAGEFKADAWELYMGQNVFNPEIQNSLYNFKLVCLSLILSVLSASHLQGVHILLSW